MNAFLRIAMTLAVVSLPVYACAAEEARASKDSVAVIESVSHIKLVGTYRGELATESEVEVHNGQWAIISSNRGPNAEPVMWVAISIGDSAPPQEFPEDSLAVRMSSLKHLSSGELTVWYYLADCDNMEIAWSTSRIDDLKFENWHVKPDALTNRTPHFEPTRRISVTVSQP